MHFQPRLVTTGPTLDRLCLKLRKRHLREKARFVIAPTGQRFRANLRRHEESVDLYVLAIESLDTSGILYRIKLQEENPRLSREGFLFINAYNPHTRKGMLTPQG